MRPISRFFILVTAACLITGCTPGFKPIFDGKTLDGWRVVGGQAAYRVDKGEIVGTVGPGANSFLRTEKTYADFEFRCQFKWGHPSNSGIQYRSHQKQAEDGSHTGQVYGYQFELDPSPRAWSGGLYEEGRRGWIVNLEGPQYKKQRAAIKLDDWNDIVIKCTGNHIRTWLNGVPIVSHVDEDDLALTEGFIALQVHWGKQGVMRWRKLRIKELKPTDEAYHRDRDAEQHLLLTQAR